ncbi:MAG: CHAT domain-containing protein [Acidobacteriota bacterium]
MKAPFAKCPAGPVRMACLALTAVLWGCQLQPALSKEGDRGLGQIASGAEQVTFHFARGTFFCLRVEQRGVDLEVHVDSPDGQRLLSRNEVQHGGSEESLCASAETAGAYSVEFEVAQAQELPGSFFWVLDTVQPTSAADQDFLDAERAVFDAFAAIRKGTAEGLEDARDGYGAAADAWLRLGKPARAGRSLALRGASVLNLGLADEAESDLKRALAIAEQEQLEWLSAFCNLWLGGIAQRRSETQAEMAYTRTALDIFRRVGDPLGEAEAIESLAHSLVDRVAFDEAKELLERNMEVWEGLGNPQKQGKTLGYLGLIAEEEGRLDEAFDLHRRALALRHAAEDPVGVAVTLNNLAKAHFAAGDYDKDLEFWHRAAEEIESTGRKEYLGSILGNLGSLYKRLGQPERARTTYRQAFEIAEKAGSGRRMVNLRNNMGNAAISLGEFDAAREHLEWALNRARTLGLEDLFAATLKNLGDLELKRWQRKTSDVPPAAARRALQLFEQAEATFEEHGFARELTGTLIGRARSQWALGEVTAAEDLFRRAIDQARRLRDLPRHELAHSFLAELLAESGRLREASRHYSEAISIVESRRGALAGRDLRSTYMSKRRRLYAEAARTRVRAHRESPDLGHLETAFALAERGKARSLVDFLAAAKVEVEKGVDPGLSDRLRSAERRIAFHERRWAGADRRGDSEAAAAHLDEIEKQSRRRDELLQELQEMNPRLEALTTGLTIDVGAVRREVLPENGLFLEYVLGDEGSLLFAISRDSFRVYELPPGPVIEAEVERFLAAVVGSSASGRARRSAKRLSDLLLRPAAEFWTHTPSWLQVVGDGWLHGLPFSYLPSPVEAETRPLLEETRIVQLPSASATLLLKSSEVTKEYSKILAVASPRYAIQPLDVEDASRRAEMPRLPPLRFARQEAEMIAKLAPDRAVVLLDADASVGGVSDLELGGFDLLHFGVHAIIEPSRPGASGLVLAMLDEEGRAREGLLSVREVYNFDLNAQLVVLSACHSAGGDLVRGEGLVGLVSAFLYAGSRNVVASLWQVEDRATSILMTSFYRYLLEERMPPAEALRAAQLSLRRQPEFSAPYFWAPFILVGPGA